MNPDLYESLEFTVSGTIPEAGGVLLHGLSSRQGTVYTVSLLELPDHPLPFDLPPTVRVFGKRHVDAVTKVLKRTFGDFDLGMLSFEIE